MRDKYLRLCHAMQSGVAAMLSRNPDYPDCQPKHLRVGINTAMSDHGALVKLLIEKGLFTLEEYERYLVDGMQAEADSYQKQVTEMYGGAEIHLA